VVEDEGGGWGGHGKGSGSLWAQVELDHRPLLIRQGS
jgi:hypothetical protein